MLKDKQGHILSDQEKIKRRRDNKTDSFKKASYEEEPEILDSKVKASLKALGRNTVPGVDWMPIELFQAAQIESVQILMRICQQIWQTKQWPRAWKHSVCISGPTKKRYKTVQKL
ncbi:Tol-Pal system protein TolB [Varanus komodoensis]|nr:Tol-Pal system protein TolB [Varanus komodoensis]